MKKQHITAFYLETLLLILVFVAIILVLSQIFGIGKAQSSQAKLLTNAVCLAGNGAEAVSASGSEAELQALLDQNGNTAWRQGDPPVLSVRYDTDMRPDPAGRLRMDITWVPGGETEERFVTSTISVYYGEQTKPVYALDTAVFLGEVAS